MATLELVSEAEAPGLKALAEAPAEVLDAIPAAVYVVDADGRLLRFNRRAAAIWGRIPRLGEDAERYCGAGKADAPDGPPPPLSEAPMAEVLRTGQPSRDREVEIERPDGSRAVLLVNIDPLRDAAGRLVGAINCFQDVTERRRGHAALAESERRARELLNALPVAIYTTDREGRITFYNQAAVEFSGRTPVIGSDSWCVTWRLYDADGAPLPHDLCPMATTLKSGVDPKGRVIAIAERPDGSRVPFTPFPKLLRDASGRVTGAINMLVDMTERKRAEDEQRALIDELNHRVKNTLATVQSIAAQTMRSTPHEFIENFDARVMALSQAHNLLTRRRWTGVGLGELLDQQFGALAIEDERLTLEGPEITLSPRIGLLLGMLIHELATNATQHGALSLGGGKVRLQWSVSEADDRRRGLSLRWTESGGRSVTLPAKRGFGIRLLERSVAKDLRGRVDLRFPPAGVQCDIDFPLE